MRGLASAVSHTCTSGVHLHYSAPPGIIFMSQVAPGKTARVGPQKGFKWEFVFMLSRSWFIRMLHCKSLNLADKFSGLRM